MWKRGRKNGEIYNCHEVHKKTICLLGALVWFGKVVFNKAEGLDVGPLSASSEGDPQYPQKKEGK
jgi:hypothetical protein